DFGLVSIDGQRLTRTGSVVGSLLYLSPEQAYGQRATPASDLYSLGCVLYHLMAGRPPFSSGVPGEILQMHVCEQATPLTELYPRIPRGVDRILGRAMAKNPTDRYESASQFADDLLYMLQHETAPAMTEVPKAPFGGNEKPKLLARIKDYKQGLLFVSLF